MDTFTIKSGDTQPPLEVALLSNELPVDLTSATEVRLHLRATEGGPLLIDAAMTIVGSAADGVVKYQWVAGDTDVVGLFYAEYVVTWATGEQTFPDDGYSLIEVTPGLDATTGTLPDLPDSCWPVDEAMCSEFADYSVRTRGLAKALAVETLMMLTAYRVGGCDITIRPCNVWCWETPCVCGNSCHNLGRKAFRLGGHVGHVTEVIIDGVVLDESAYRVDNGDQLVRIDGDVWPITQDMTLATTEVDTFAVTYLAAAEVDALGSMAAGIMACEFAKALSGSKECRLPAAVTAVVRQGFGATVTRQGITTEVRSAYPNNLTGIREVDSYITRWNPLGRKSSSRVWSPDVKPIRVTTWQA